MEQSGNSHTYAARNSMEQSGNSPTGAAHDSMEQRGNSPTGAAPEPMKVIGITGGIGAGKSEVLKCIESACPCRIVLTDELARDLQLPGKPCYRPIVELLGESVLTEGDIGDGYGSPIDRDKMASMIFSDDTLLNKVNSIVHPEVFKALKDMIEKERAHRIAKCFFVESALIDRADDYSFLDEIWYIRAEADVRIDRLMKSRGYSREKAEGIIANQKSDEYFCSIADRIIDNSTSLDEMRREVFRIFV